MGDATRIYLGTTFSCVIGGDAWYLVERAPGDLVLEGRFEDDRGALGQPPWINTSFCTERSEWGSSCVLPLTQPLAATPSEEYRFVPESVWAAARTEAEKLAGKREDA